VSRCRASRIFQARPDFLPPAQPAPLPAPLPARPPQRVRRLSVSVCLDRRWPERGRRRRRGRAHCARCPGAAALPRAASVFAPAAAAESRGASGWRRPARACRGFCHAAGPCGPAASCAACAAAAAVHAPSPVGGVTSGLAHPPRQGEHPPRTSPRHGHCKAHSIHLHRTACEIACPWVARPEERGLHRQGGPFASTEVKPGLAHRSSRAASAPTSAPTRSERSGQPRERGELSGATTAQAGRPRQNRQTGPPARCRVSRGQARRLPFTSAACPRGSGSQSTWGGGVGGVGVGVGVGVGAGGTRPEAGEGPLEGQPQGARRGVRRPEMVVAAGRDHPGTASRPQSRLSPRRRARRRAPATPAAPIIETPAPSPARGPAAAAPSIPHGAGAHSTPPCPRLNSWLSSMGSLMTRFLA
jgi:hypothetical protein